MVDTNYTWCCFNFDKPLKLCRKLLKLLCIGPLIQILQWVHVSRLLQLFPIQLLAFKQWLWCTKIATFHLRITHPIHHPLGPISGLASSPVMTRNSFLWDLCYDANHYGHYLGGIKIFSSKTTTSAAKTWGAKRILQRKLPRSTHWALSATTTCKKFGGLVEKSTPKCDGSSRISLVVFSVQKQENRKNQYSCTIGQWSCTPKATISFMPNHSHGSKFSKNNP